MKRILGLVLILSLISFSIIGCSNSGSSLQEDDEIDKVDAWVLAQNIVEKNLKNPSSAEFCTYPEATVTSVGDSFDISGWVDATNSLGGTIRISFSMILVETSPGTWSAENFEME